MKGIFYLFFIFCLLGCSQTRDCRITVDVDPVNLKLEDKKITMERFEVALKEVIDQKIESGCLQAHILIRMNVDPEVKRGFLSSIELILRRLNIKKIEYSNL